MSTIYKALQDLCILWIIVYMSCKVFFLIVLFWFGCEREYHWNLQPMLALNMRQSTCRMLLGVGIIGVSHLAQLSTKIILKNSECNIIASFSSSHSSLQTLPHSLVSFQMHGLCFHCVLLHACIDTVTYIYTQCVFLNITCSIRTMFLVCTFSGLPTGYWITRCCAFPWRRRFLLLSASLCLL